MFETAKLIRPHVHRMRAYDPILPFEVLSRQLGMSHENIVKLDANENPYGPLPIVAEELARLPYVHIYPDPESRELRQALAGYHALPVENILAGAGADELIDLIMRLFLDPGDTMVDCPPTFGMYAFDAGIAGARVVSVRRRLDFSLDLDGIERAVHTYQPKLLFLASPNNPDGSLLPSEVLDRLLELPVVVILDEAYVEFAPPGSSYIRAVSAHENLIVLRTFSKWAGLAGLRVGYGVFPSSLMPHLWKIKQPYNVSVAATRAAVVSLQNADELQEIVQQIVGERGRLFTALKSIPWLEPYPSQANFILCRVTSMQRRAGGGHDAAAMKAELARAGILVRYFNKPGLEDHVRISVGKPEHTDALLEKLAEWE
jgi:histidinol-phosphate aminotransferase